ncbi:MAG: YggS family pyridoxal phosphate-dependent enzyme [Acidimicrobiales bacterium]
MNSSGSSVTATSGEISDRVAEVRTKLDEVGRPDTRIVAVTKGFGPDTVAAARAAGLTEFGESYAQELEEKTPAFEGIDRMHFIGRIQRNKVRRIASVVDLWHSVARESVLREIAKRRDDATVLLQIRIGDDETKDGIGPGQIEDMLVLGSELGVEVRGLMTIGVRDDADGTRRAFEELRVLADRHDLSELSMGMSADYLDAAAAGATILRLGSVLFGPRPH